MIEEKTECRKLKDAIVTLRKLSGSELQQAIFEAELDAKRIQNAEISTAKEQGIKKGIEKGVKKGIKEGKIESKIEDVINLVLATR